MGARALIAVALAALAALACAFIGWRLWFHRDPTRSPPPGDAPVCAADGRVLYVDDVDLDSGDDAYHARVRDAFGVRGRWSVTAVFLSPFDVHWVRAPLAGRVRLRPIAAIGKNGLMGAAFIYALLRRPLPLGRRGYAAKNEILGIEIDGEVRLLLVLMADWWIDQIQCAVADGASVERGQRLAKIHMGSQVDVWAPAGALAGTLAPGDRVFAGTTVFADRIEHVRTAHG